MSFSSKTTIHVFLYSMRIFMIQVQQIEVKFVEFLVANWKVEVVYCLIVLLKQSSLDFLIYFCMTLKILFTFLLLLQKSSVIFALGFHFRFEQRPRLQFTGRNRLLKLLLNVYLKLLAAEVDHGFNQIYYDVALA